MGIVKQQRCKGSFSLIGKNKSQARCECLHLMKLNCRANIHVLIDENTRNELES
jgi:acetyl-CoA carboxylase beta subunit